jgi:NADH-quinone oxidoreductase subunit H
MAFGLETLAKIGFMLAFMLAMLPVLIWAERKGAAFIQDRTGPNRASILGLRLGGLVHPIADVLKLVFKEDVVPARAHKFLHSLAPFIVMTVALSTFAVIPFGDFLEAGGRRVPLIVADLNAGILYVFAVASLGTYGIVIGGWAANNKYTFLGAVRSGAQMISYEIGMGLSLMGLLLIFSSFSLMDIVRGQGQLLWGFLPMWGVVVQPLGALLFITAVYAETNRTPFDLPEGDSELVAGYHLEYSSLKFALFFMAEYCNMVVGAALITTLFFGGWQIPWLPRARLVAHAGPLLTASLAATSVAAAWFACLLARRARRERGKFGDARDREPGCLAVVCGAVALAAAGSLALRPWTIGPGAASFYATAAQTGAFLGKTICFAWLFIWVRWTLPRFRYDQLMRLGWKVMLPLGLANLAITALVLALL